MGSGKETVTRRRSSDQPNILIIVTDDQGYADLSAYDHSADDIETPGMDRIAEEGILFTQAYVTAPVCSPSRAGWNTGCYQQRWNPEAGWDPGLPENVRHIAEYLRAAGYATGKVGKNDYGTGYHSTEPREYPLNHGFDEFLGFSSHAHDYFLLSEGIEKRTPDPYGHSAALGTLFLNNERVSYQGGYTTEIFTDWAVDFLRRYQEKPFFLTVSYNSVHHLIHEVPDRYLRKFDAKPITNYEPETMGTYSDYYNKYNQLGAIDDENMRRYYLANLNCLDDNVGRLLDSMDQLGLSDNTLVILFSDNGGSPLTAADNRPLRGAKYLLWEGGIRVPFIMRWPDRLPKGRIYPHRTSTLDIVPTCLEAADAEIPKAFDGESMLEGVQQGTPAPFADRPIFWQFQKQFAVRDGDWKLVKANDSPGRQPTNRFLGGPASGDEPCLFNLKDDLSEQRDVCSKYPAVAQRLEGLYKEWRQMISK
jgi:arylsulfatase A-like enzyme